MRQAVVIVHGMGEQLPLDTLCGFVGAALAPDAKGERLYYSRPESVTGSFESRRFLAPCAVDAEGREVHAQTEFFEYHWADKMQGNRLDDLWPTFRRILLQSPTRVPAGLKGIWWLAWALIITAVWAAIWGPWRGLLTDDGDLVPRLVGAVVSGGVGAALVSYLISRVLPAWLTSSFVDVVRYLDTSPRSYAVRRDIRKGLIEMLQALHEARYDRIVVVAHSLGGFIAYDAIAYLWGQMNATTLHDGIGRSDIAGLERLENAASALHGSDTSDEAVAEYLEAQRDLWFGIRDQGNPWLITDFVSVGTPMYFADQLLKARGGRDFEARKDRRELPLCPPHNEEETDNNLHQQRCFYSWNKAPWWETHEPTKKRVRVQRRVLNEGAPFAVVRWTNVYFTTRYGFFGDWFGGELGRLFGPGIRDVEATGNTRGRPGTTLLRNRLVPALAHTYYFSFPDDDAEDSASKAIRDGLDLASTKWLDDGRETARAAATAFEVHPPDPSAPAASVSQSAQP